MDKIIWMWNLALWPFVETLSWYPVIESSVCDSFDGQATVDEIQCIPDISRSLFFPNKSRQTPIARPLGRAIGVFREFKFWSKFYFRSYYARCNIVLYCTMKYREYMWVLDLQASYSDLT